MAAPPYDCEWYHIGDYSGQSTTQNTPRTQSANAEEQKQQGGTLSSTLAKKESGSRLASQLLERSMQVGRCLEETTAALRPGSRTLLWNSSRPGAQCAPVTPSATTDDQCSESASVRGDEKTAGTSRKCNLELEQGASEEKRAEMLNLQWCFVRENVQAFVQEISSLRSEFQDVLRTAVAEEVGKRFSASLESVTEVRRAIEEEVLNRQSGDNEINDVIGQMKRNLTDELREGLRQASRALEEELLGRQSSDDELRDLICQTKRCLTEELREVRKAGDLREGVKQVSLALEEEVLARRTGDDEVINMVSQIKRSLTEELRDTRKAEDVREDVRQVSRALEEEVLARQSCDDEIRNMAHQIKRSLTEELRDTRKALLDSSHDLTNKSLLRSQLNSSSNSVDIARPHLSTKAVAQLDKQISTASAECAANIADMAQQLKGILNDIDKEPSKPLVAGESINSPVAAGSTSLAKVLLGDTYECQRLRSVLLAKINEQPCLMDSRCARAPSDAETRTSDDDVELHETLRGLFASVRALQEALNREIELREMGAAKLRKSFQDDILRFTGDAKKSWQSEVRQMWSVIDQLDVPDKAVSPGRKRLSESSLLRQRDALLTHCRRTLARSHTQSPTRMSRPEVVGPEALRRSAASAASRSPSPKVVRALGQLRE